MVDEMVAEMNQVGFQEIMAEAQRQVDEFLAANPASSESAE